MSPALQAMFRRFSLVYGQPSTSDPAGLLAEYEWALAGWSDAAVERGTDAVVKYHLVKAWPTPGEVVERVKQAAAELERERRRSEPLPPPMVFAEPPAPDAAARVKAMTDAFVAKMRAQGHITGRRT